MTKWMVTEAVLGTAGEQTQWRRFTQIVFKCFSKILREYRKNNDNNESKYNVNTRPCNGEN